MNFSLRERQIQARRDTEECFETVMSIERNRVLVLCVHHHCKCSDVRPNCARDRVPQQYGTKTAAPKREIDRKPANLHSGYAGIAWQLLGDGGRKFRQGDAGARDRVIARDPPSSFGRNIACGHAAANILRRLLTKIVVERVDAAYEGLSIMNRR